MNKCDMDKALWGDGQLGDGLRHTSDNRVCIYRFDARVLGPAKESFRSFLDSDYYGNVRGRLLPCRMGLLLASTII